MELSGDRRAMMDLLRSRGIRDVRVLRAFEQIPREAFVPPHEQNHPYVDAPIPIGHGQTISQPYMTALMAQSLELRGDETVLEVGGGSGFHAAVLGRLAARVISIELIPELAALARTNLETIGADANVMIIAGDGSLGYPDLAPFDAISVAAGAPQIPPALLNQLADPGRLIIPVGSAQDQDLQIAEKVNGRIEFRVVSQCRFVPLLGQEGWRA